MGQEQEDKTERKERKDETRDKKNFMTKGEKRWTPLKKEGMANLRQ